MYIYTLQYSQNLPYKLRYIKICVDKCDKNFDENFFVRYIASSWKYL